MHRFSINRLFAQASFPSEIFALFLHIPKMTLIGNILSALLAARLLYSIYVDFKLRAVKQSKLLITSTLSQFPVFINVFITFLSRLPHRVGIS